MHQENPAGSETPQEKRKKTMNGEMENKDIKHFALAGCFFHAMIRKKNAGLSSITPHEKGEVGNIPARH